MTDQELATIKAELALSWTAAYHAGYEEALSRKEQAAIESCLRNLEILLSLR